METKLRNHILAFLAAGFVWAYVFIYQLLCTYQLGMSGSGSRAALNVLWASALAALTLFIGLGIFERNRAFVFAYRHRVSLAAVAFVALVALNLNGSSIAFWSNYVSDAQMDGLLFGSPLAIRSDEWDVWTPMAVSQGFAGYPSVSPLLSGGGVATEWVSMGGVPALGLAALFKPLYWGFFLLGSERGFSFLWNARWILLFLVSFEFFTKLAKENKLLGFLGAVLVSYAPVVQWFFSQSIAELIFFSEGIVLCLERFLQKTPVRSKIFWAVAASYLFGCLVMIGYPAWIVPQLYLILTLAVVLLFKRRQTLNKAGVLAMCASLAAVVACLLTIVYRTSDTLVSVSQSVYPGARFFTGGVGFNDRYRVGFAQFFYPFAYQLNAIGNPCELSAFIDLFPAGLLLAVIALLRGKKKDPVLVGVAALGVVLVSFMVFGFPNALAKASLLSYSSCDRMVVIFGLINILLLIRSLAVMDKLHPLAAVACALACIAFSFCTERSELYAGFGLAKLFRVGCPMLFFGLIFFAAHRKSSAALGCAVLVLSTFVFSAGFVVNPVQHGFDPLNESETIRQLKEMPTEEDELWLVESAPGNYFYGDLLLFAGKPVLNCTQEYPNAQRWSAVDPSGEYNDVYNRFCHITVQIVEEPTEFALLYAADLINLSLNVDDLPKLGVTRLMTAQEYPDQLGSVRFRLLSTAGSFRVYELDYDPVAR